MEKGERILVSALIVAVIAYFLLSLVGLLPAQYDIIQMMSSTSTMQMLLNVVFISLFTIFGIAINRPKKNGWRRN